MGIFGLILFLLLVIAIVLPFFSFETVEQAGKFLLINFIISFVYISAILVWHYVVDPNNDVYRGIGAAIHGFYFVCIHTFMMIIYILTQKRD